MNKNFDLPYIYKHEWFNKRTLDNGETVDVGHNGEIVITIDDVVVCGDGDIIFAYYKDDMYKVIYNGEEKQTSTRTFTIDNFNELRFFNAVQDYVNTHGKEYHGVYYTDLEETPVIKNKCSTEEIMRASDNDLGINFIDAVGKAYGVDYDEETREERRLNLAIVNAERAGKVDPKNIDNKKNIYFGLDVDDAVESKKYALQRLERGFDDTETWNLDSTVSRFVAPRLRRFIELNNAYPSEMTPEEWDEKLNIMLWAFEHHCYEDWIYDKTTGEPIRETGDKDGNLFECYFWDLPEDMQNNIRQRIEEGVKLFGEWLPAIWW